MTVGPRFLHTWLRVQDPLKHTLTPAGHDGLTPHPIPWLNSKCTPVLPSASSSLHLPQLLLNCVCDVPVKKPETQSHPILPVKPTRSNKTQDKTFEKENGLHVCLCIVLRAKPMYDEHCGAHLSPNRSAVFSLSLGLVCFFFRQDLTL